MIASMKNVDRFCIRKTALVESKNVEKEIQLMNVTIITHL